MRSYAIAGDHPWFEIEDITSRQGTRIDDPKRQTETETETEKEVDKH